MDAPVLVDQPRLMFISFVGTLDAGKRACQERYTIGMDGEGKSQENPCWQHDNNYIYEDDVESLFFYFLFMYIPQVFDLLILIVISML